MLLFKTHYAIHIYTVVIFLPVNVSRDIIMDCIEDKDESIRIRALELIMGMSNKKNIVEIVRKLMSHIDITESTCESTYNSICSLIR